MIHPERLSSWWRHQMETFSALLAMCARKSPMTGEFPVQRPVTRSFDVFFDRRLNKWLSKQLWGWWFEMPSRSLWRHSNDQTLIPRYWNCRNYPSPGMFTMHWFGQFEAIYHFAWWTHEAGILSALLDFPLHRVCNAEFLAFLCCFVLNKPLNTQSSCRWLKTVRRSCDVSVIGGSLSAVLATTHARGFVVLCFVEVELLGLVDSYI